jgi:hypothetical protein
VLACLSAAACAALLERDAAPFATAAADLAARAA